MVEDRILRSQNMRDDYESTKEFSRNLRILTSSFEM